MNVSSWPRIASHFHVTGVRCGREAAILILKLRISVGSSTAARRNYLGVRCVPEAGANNCRANVCS